MFVGNGFRSLSAMNGMAAPAPPSDAPRPGRRSLLERTPWRVLAPAALLAVAAGVGWLQVWNSPLLLAGPDAGSWMDAVAGLRDQGRLPEVASRGPLFPFLVLAAGKLSGCGDPLLAARAVNLLSWLLAFLSLYLLAARTLGPKLAFAGTLAAIVGPPWHWTCHSFNADSLAVAGALGCWLLGWQALRSERWEWLVAAALAFVLFLLTHLVAIGYVMLFALSGALWLRGRRRWFFPLCFLLAWGLLALLVESLLGALPGNEGIAPTLRGRFSLFGKLLLESDAWGLTGSRGAAAMEGVVGPTFEAVRDSYTMEGLLIRGRLVFSFVRLIPELLPLPGLPATAVGIGAAIVLTVADRRSLVARERSGRSYLLLYLAPVAGHLLVSYIPHYFSPLPPVLALLAVAGWQHLWVWAGRQGPAHRLVSFAPPRLRRHAGWLGWLLLAGWAALLVAGQPPRPVEAAALLEVEAAAWLGRELPKDAVVLTNSLEMRYRLSQRTERLRVGEVVGAAEPERYRQLLADELRLAGASLPERPIYLLHRGLNMTAVQKAAWEELVGGKLELPGLRLVAHWPHEEGHLALFRWREP